MLVGLVEALDDVFEDGLHARPPLVPQPSCDAHHRVGGAVAVGEDAGVEQVDADRAGLVGEVDEAHPVDKGPGDVFEETADEVGVGVDDDDGVGVPPLGLLAHLVGNDVVHEGGLAHAGAGDVEVVTAEQVVREVDRRWLSRRGVSDERSTPHASRRGKEHPRAGALDLRRLVSGAGRMPEGGGLADADDAALPEEDRHLQVRATC